MDDVWKEREEHGLIGFLHFRTRKILLWRTVHGTIERTTHDRRTMNENEDRQWNDMNLATRYERYWDRDGDCI